MLKKQAFLLIAVVTFVSLTTGCSATKITNKMIGEAAGFEMSKAKILNRPSEYQIKERRVFTATGFYKKVLGITVEGEKVSINAPILGFLSGNATSPAEASAVKEILAKDPGADGAIILQSIIEEESFGFFFSTQTASVKVLTYNLKNLGPISKKEATALRLYGGGGAGSLLTEYNQNPGAEKNKRGLLGWHLKPFGL